MHRLLVLVLPALFVLAACDGEGSAPAGGTGPSTDPSGDPGASQTTPALPPPGAEARTIPAETVTCAGKFATVKLNVVSANGVPSRLTAEVTSAPRPACAPVSSTWTARIDASIVRVDRSPERVVLVLGEAHAQTAIDTTTLTPEEQASDCIAKTPSVHEDRAIPVTSVTLAASTIGQVLVQPSDASIDLGSDCVAPEMVSGLRNLVSALQK